MDRQVADLEAAGVRIEKKFETRSKRRNPPHIKCVEFVVLLAVLLTWAACYHDSVRCEIPVHLIDVFEANCQDNSCWMNAVLQATLSTLVQLRDRPIQLQSGSTRDAHEIFLCGFKEMIKYKVVISRAKRPRCVLR